MVKFDLIFFVDLTCKVIYFTGVCPDIYQCYNYTEGETCLITCSGNGTLSHGNNKITCQSDGLWSEKIPICKGGFVIVIYFTALNKVIYMELYKLVLVVIKYC